jgi:hypothetical protein
LTYGTIRQACSRQTNIEITLMLIGFGIMNRMLAGCGSVLKMGTRDKGFWCKVEDAQGPGGWNTGKMSKRSSLDELFKGRHFLAEVIVVCVRWYLEYKLSSRDISRLMAEREISVDHSTILRWVRRYVVSRTGCKTRCCMRDDGRSIGAALWEEASNCRKRLRSKGVVVCVSVKRRNKYVKCKLERRAQANL